MPLASTYLSVGGTLCARLVQVLPAFCGSIRNIIRRHRRWGKQGMRSTVSDRRRVCDDVIPVRGNAWAKNPFARAPRALSSDARLNRDLTVPSASPVMSATSWYSNPSISHITSTIRWPGGNCMIARVRSELSSPRTAWSCGEERRSLNRRSRSGGSGVAVEPAGIVALADPQRVVAAVRHDAQHPGPERAAPVLVDTPVDLEEALLHCIGSRFRVAQQPVRNVDKPGLDSSGPAH